MRKLLTIIVFLLVLALAAAPALMGLAIDRVGNAALKDAKAHAGDIVVESGTIDGGYLSSAVTATLRPASSYESVRADLTVRHFLPLGRLAGVHGQLTGAIGQHRVVGDIGFALDSEWTISPQAGSGSGEARLAVDKDVRNLLLQLTELSVNDVVRAATGDVQFQTTTTTSWSARADISVKQLTVADFAASDIDMETTAAREAEDLSLDFSAEALGYTWQNTSGDSARGRLRIRQLHAPTIERLVKALQEISENDLPNADQQVQQAFFTALGPILVHQPIIDTLEGKTRSDKGNAEFIVSGRVTERPPSNFLSDLDALMGVVELRIEAEFSEPMIQWWAARKVAEEYPFVDQPQLQDELRREAILTLQNNGIIRPVVGGYEMNINYKPGRVVLNGQAMSLPDGFFSQM